MLLICTSDTHGELPLIEGEFDLFVFAGDACPVWNHDIDFQYHWLQDIWMPYLRSIIDRGAAKDVVWTFGNHDFVGDILKFANMLTLMGGDDSHFDIYSYLRGHEHIHLLVSETVEIGGLKIHGHPYVGNLEGWAFNRPDDELQRLAEAIPECDILVSHAPPQGYGDRTSYTHAGDPYLEEELARIGPKLVICGHIHESAGAYNHPHVSDGVWSVSYLDRHYKVRNDPLVIIEIDIP